MEFLMPVYIANSKK